jgi:hypothetical protein
VSRKTRLIKRTVTVRHTEHTSPVSGVLIGYARVSSDAQDLTARVAAAAGDDPDVLRMGNLDTDIPPSEEAIEATRAASLFTVSPHEEG